uniref:Sugar phosphate transporter domain-containing protein n=1 Tax=Alexandrium monilatum TaxID=311494 RepID=A0A7S4SPQ4_9DINO
MSPAAQVCWCCFYAAGLIGMLALYGVLQERIMTMPYGGVVFGYSVFLVFCNRLAAVIFAAVMLRLSGEPVLPQAPLWKYLIISLSNVYASTCQYEALKHVSFVVQMLGKSFKMMPVMLWGMAISGKRYSVTDWLIAAGVTFGVTEFLMTGPTASPTDRGSSARGLLLLLAFLALDGLTSTMQEKLFKEHPVTKYNQMLYINIFSAGITLGVMLTMRTFRTASDFCQVHPAVVVDIIELCLASIAGQWFIYSLLKEFGALILATTLAVRQVVSTLISYIYYHHVITPLQAVALVLVFGALLGRTLLRFSSFSERFLERRQLLAKRMDEDDAPRTTILIDA